MLALAETVRKLKMNCRKLRICKRRRALFNVFEGPEKKSQKTYRKKELR